MARTEGRADTLEMDARYGVGTTGYVRSVGGCALRLERGSHDAPQSVEAANRALRNTQAQLGLRGETPPPIHRIEALLLVSVVHKATPPMLACATGTAFDAWKDGDWIGRRANGELV